MDTDRLIGMKDQTKRLAAEAATWSHQAALLARNATEALGEVERQRAIVADLLSACEAAEAEMDACGATSTETLDQLRAAIARARGD